MSSEIQPAALFKHENALAPHYSRFRVADRLLLTGHSHQAWPDCGFEGQCRAWEDAARLVDQKWSEAFARAERVRNGLKRVLDDDTGHYTLGSNTHELLVRFLSGLDLRKRLVTTDGEFHTIRRQLHRLAEEGIEVVRIKADPETIAERLMEKVDDQTAAVLVSSVLFQSARIVPGIAEVVQACRQVGAEILIDVYHHAGVVPLSVRELGWSEAFLVGGGYKYLQLGEGNCFLRSPEDCSMRPVITGWFAEFALLDKELTEVGYPEGPDRFAGSTYDPTSHYRAAAVLDFFEVQHLTSDLLRTVSQHQVGRLLEGFDGLDLDPEVIDRDRSVRLAEIGGFVTLVSDHAEKIAEALRARGVHTDFRGRNLRLGPAPYLSDQQLDECIAALGEVVTTF